MKVSLTHLDSVIRVLNQDRSRFIGRPGEPNGSNHCPLGLGTFTSNGIKTECRPAPTVVRGRDEIGDRGFAIFLRRDDHVLPNGVQSENDDSGFGLVVGRLDEGDCGSQRS